MKNFRAFLVAVSCFLMVILISSCSMMKNNDFTSQKYTHFTKGESPAIKNTVAKETKNDKSYAFVSEEKTTTKAVNITLDESTQTVVNPLPKDKKATNIIVKNNTFLTKEINKVKRNHNISFNRFLNNANTASVDGGGADLIVLVILAIFIPPLSVFLAKGLGSDFWLDLLLTILFWVPGVIFALLVAFDVI